MHCGDRKQESFLNDFPMRHPFTFLLLFFAFSDMGWLLSG